MADVSDTLKFDAKKGKTITQHSVKDGTQETISTYEVDNKTGQRKLVSKEIKDLGK